MRDNQSDCRINAFPHQHTKARVFSADMNMDMQGYLQAVRGSRKFTDAMEALQRREFYRMTILDCLQIGPERADRLLGIEIGCVLDIVDDDLRAGFVGETDVEAAINQATDRLMVRRANCVACPVVYVLGHVHRIRYSSLRRWMPEEACEDMCEGQLP